MSRRSRIAEAFAKAKTEGRATLIVYVCAGDPDLATTERLVPALVAAGADVVELGVPFSDPIADGPVIQEASERALAAGTTLRAILELVARLRSTGFDAPVALMSYLNPIHALRDLDAVARAGVDGLIVPDLPFDEAAPWRRDIEERGMDLVALASPTTEPARLAALGGSSTGFLYFVSVTGVTGTRRAFPPELPQQLVAARRVSKVPVAVGFGVESTDQARSVGAHADGVIVGSALIKVLQGPDGFAAALTFVSQLASAMRPGSDAALPTHSTVAAPSREVSSC